MQLGQGHHGRGGGSNLGLTSVLSYQGQRTDTQEAAQQMNQHELQSCASAQQGPTDQKAAVEKVGGETTHSC